MLCISEIPLKCKPEKSVGIYGGGWGLASKENILQNGINHLIQTP